VAEEPIAASRMPFAIRPSQGFEASLPTAPAVSSETLFRAIIGLAAAGGALMTAITPFLKNAEKLGPLASRYVEVESLPWKPTPCPGIDMKILLEDPETGLMTALFRWRPGSELALHEHVEIEQTFVLEGSLVDKEGEVRAGNYVWRPKGNRHVARSPNGALVLSMFLKPNIFLAGDAAGQDLR
jgi:anti-sigma factor ChrR (cupin superfamily)